MSDAFAEMFSPLLSEDTVTGTNGNGNAQKMGNTDSEAKVDSLGQPLLNRKPPQYVRQQEHAWHRVALEYASQGYTAREIAGMLRCSPTAVQDILRQPGYQQLQVNLIHKAVTEDQKVVDTIKASVVEAVETLGEIMRDAKVKPSDRIAASRELLSRRYGLPNQPINRNTDVDLNKLSDAELAKILQNDMATTTGTQ